jgi:DNA-binding transcriptional MerR regulator
MSASPEARAKMSAAARERRAKRAFVTDERNARHVVRECRVESCARLPYARGLCRAHYEREKRLGDAEAETRIGGPKFTPAALEEAGVNRRRLHHWHALGHLRAPLAVQGNRRVWNAEELRVALLMARLVDAGVDLTRAAQFAREVVTKGRTSFSIAQGLSLQIRELEEHRTARPW